jgi:RHS repeat-associated protein
MSRSSLAIALAALAILARNAQAQIDICETYIAITQYPPDPYYQTTADITVAWGEILTEDPACLSSGPPDGGTFHFTVNGVDRTGYFTVGWDGAWGSVPLVSGLNTLRATITGHDAYENPRTDRDTKTTHVYPGASPQPPIVDVQSVNPGPFVGKGLCLTVAAGSDAAYECGDLRIVHPLFAVRTLGEERAPTLLYNSDHAHPWPLVAANVELPSTAMVPDSVVARLLVNSVERRRSPWPGSYWAPGTVRRIVVGFDGLNDTTGVYSYSLEVTNWYPSGPQPGGPATGELVIVNRSVSPFGAGWWLAGLERVKSVGNGRKLRVGGDGSALVYTPVPGDSNLYVAANPAHPDTLDGHGADWVRIAPHGVRIHYRKSDGRHTTTVGRLGHETVFDYYGDGNLHTIAVAPQGAFTYYFDWYNAGGTLSAVAVGTLVTFFTMDAGRLSAIHNYAWGDSVGFGFSPTMPKRIASRTDRRGTVTTYSYDQTGKKLTRFVVQMVVSPNLTTSFAPLEIRGLAPLDTSLAYTRIDGPRPGWDYTDVWLDRFGAPRRIRDALSRITELEHDPLWPASVSRVRYPDGRVVRAAYNTMGLVASVTDSSLCRGSQCAITSYDYDSKWGFVTKIARPEGDTSFFGYNDTTGSRTIEFNNRPNLPDTVVYNYGSALKLLSSIVLPGQVQRDSFTYDTRGNLETARTPSGLVTSYSSDDYGFTHQTTTPGGIVTTTYRNPWIGLDTLVQTSGPARSVHDEWSDQDWDPETLSVKKVYDPEGNLIETRRHATPSWIDTIVEYTHYDRANRPVKLIAADGQPDSIRYNEAGNPVEFVTRRQHHIMQDFDLAGQLTQRRLPAVTEYAQQQWEGWTWPAVPVQGDTVRFYYDAAGRDTLAVNRYAQVRRRYAKGGLLTWEEQRIRSWAQQGASTWSTAGFDVHVYPVTYDYDLDGRRVSLGHPPALGPGNDTTKYSYHSYGPLATITDPYDDQFEFLWDRQGRLDSLTYPTWHKVGEKHRYDVDGRLRYRTARRTAHTDTSYANADTISYSADGLVIAARDRLVLDSLAYTGLGRVGRMTTRTWETRAGVTRWWATDADLVNPDAFGNVVWKSHAVVAWGGPVTENHYTFDAATGRVEQQEDFYEHEWYGKPVTYDLAGNQRYEDHWKLALQCSDGDIFTCAEWTPYHREWATGSYYDAEQHLIELRRQTTMSQPDVDQVGGREFYQYDPYGRRILRGWLSDLYVLGMQIWQDRYLYRYVWDGNQILYEIRSDYDRGPDYDFWNEDRFGRVGYVHGLTIDRPLEAFRADGHLDFSRMFLHPNWRGSITGGTVESGLKDGWPDPMIDWSRYNVTLHGQRENKLYFMPYTYFYGSLLDRQWDGSGLQYMRNRYYDPESGRFTQEDPIGLAGGLNLYGFANGDPVNFSDPFGLCPPLGLCNVLFGFLTGDWTFSARNERRVQELHPDLQRPTRMLLNFSGGDLRIAVTHRSFQDQQRAFDAGSSNARPGESEHNLNPPRAFDAYLYVGGDLDPDAAHYQHVGELAEGLGFTWGGRWSDPVDAGHFEMPGVLRAKDLFKLVVGVGMIHW